MPLNLNKYGFLEIGTHVASLDEVREKFVTDSTKKEALWERFSALVDLIKSTKAFEAIEMFGSFFSSKQEPDDIDAALELKAVDSPILEAKPLFDRDAIRRAYGADVLMKQTNSTPYRSLAGANYQFLTDDLRGFRRLDRSEMATVARIDRRPFQPRTDYKGIIRVTLA